MSSIAPYLMLLSEVKNGGGGGGGTDDRFFSVKITFDGDPFEGDPSEVNGACDKSSLELLAARDAGKILVVEMAVMSEGTLEYTMSFIPTLTSVATPPGGLVFTLHNSFVAVENNQLMGSDVYFIIDDEKSVAVEFQQIILSDDK